MELGGEEERTKRSGPSEGLYKRPRAICGGAIATFGSIAVATVGGTAGSSVTKFVAHEKARITLDLG